MRTIKFRIWTGIEMVYGNSIFPAISLNGDLFSTYSSGYQKLNHEVMQFIGLQSIDGKDIYEGDIIEVIHPKLMGYVGPHFDEVAKDTIAEKFIVEYRANNTPDGGFGSFYLNGHIHIDYVRTGKIIGNIHENPELL